MTTLTDAAGEPLRAVYQPRGPLSLSHTVGVLQRGPRDPTMASVDGTIWRATLTEHGVATLALRRAGQEVHATAWGPGATAALDAVPALCGRDDDDTGFDVSGHPLLSDVRRRKPGLRLASPGSVSDALVSAIIEQKVTGIQAFGAWRTLVTRFGARAPGPTPRPMFAAPPLDTWRTIPSWAWHRAGVEPPQSRTIVQAASRGERLVAALERARDGNERDRILRAQPGIGAWTAAEVRIRAFGDPDAVSVGDYHLPHTVGFALTGTRTDDDGMLRLLEPWRGHRQRVIRLIMASGRFEPRRGPRLAPEDHRAR